MQSTVRFPVALHMTHMGCSSLPEALIRQSLRCGLSDGWGGSMCGTEFSDVLFGTPKPIDTEANLGVMDAENGKHRRSRT